MVHSGATSKVLESNGKGSTAVKLIKKLFNVLTFNPIKTAIVLCSEALADLVYCEAVVNETLVSTLVSPHTSGHAVC